MNTVIILRTPRSFSDAGRVDRRLAAAEPRRRAGHASVRVGRVGVGVEPTSLRAEYDEYGRRIDPENSPTIAPWDHVAALDDPLRTRVLDACASNDAARMDGVATDLEAQGRTGAAQAVRTRQCVPPLPPAEHEAPPPPKAPPPKAPPAPPDTTRDRLVDTAKQVGMIAGPPLLGYLLLGPTGAIVGIAASGAIYWFGQRKE